MEGNAIVGWRPYAVRILAIAAIYYGAAKLGLDLAFAAPSVTAVWPPAGIALAAILLYGYRMWPGVALGAFLANSWTGVPLYTTLGIAAGNTLEAVVGVYLLREVAEFRPSLERVRDVLALAGLAGITSTVVAATIGVTSLLIGNEISADELGSTWRTWWLGDMGGDLVVAPAVLVAVTHWPFTRAPGRLLEALALAVATVGIAVIVFSGAAPYPYLLFPVLIWAALRFWQPGAVGATLLLAAVAVPLTEHDVGPFSAHPPDDRLLLAQTFIGVAGLTALILAAVISERMRAEEGAEEMAETLQESLLPSRLPEIPGLETAVQFQAAGKGQLVGGDFYDLFQGEDESWSIVIGDVVGKGAVAAATTGLARYTLRAAAEPGRSPSRILGVLNEAILAQSPGQCCTIAYARLVLDSPRGAHVTMSTGGHPLPVVLRAGGRVELLGEPGSLLGALPHPELADRSAELSPGDALVLYTDGLTEAYAPERIVGEQELADAVRACAGRNATAIAAGLRHALLDDADGREPRDDIVLLVIRVPPA